MKLYVRYSKGIFGEKYGLRWFFLDDLMNISYVFFFALCEFLNLFGYYGRRSDEEKDIVSKGLKLGV